MRWLFAGSTRSIKGASATYRARKSQNEASNTRSSGSSFRFSTEVPKVGRPIWRLFSGIQVVSDTCQITSNALWHPFRYMRSSNGSALNGGIAEDTKVIMRRCDSLLSEVKKLKQQNSSMEAELAASRRKQLLAPLSSPSKPGEKGSRWAEYDALHWIQRFRCR